MIMGLCLNQHDTTFFTMNFGSASRPSDKAPYHSSDVGMTYPSRHLIHPNHNHQQQQQHYHSASRHEALPSPSREQGFHHVHGSPYAGMPLPGHSPRSRSSRSRQTGAVGSANSPSLHGAGGKKRGTGAWTEAEDAKLFDLVRSFGTKNWVSVERAMEGRDKKQCRERWCNHVNPHINDAPFSEAESIFIIDCYVRHGRQWARMSRCAELQNRPDNAIKNHFNTNLRDHYAELCRQFNIPRRQPNDLLEIDEATYARVKGRITAPPASSMRGSKASRFVSSGSRQDVAAHLLEHGNHGAYSPPDRSLYAPPNMIPTSYMPNARVMEPPYGYMDDRRTAANVSYDPRHAPPSFQTPRHPPLDYNARPGWNSYPQQHPAYEDRSATSPIARFSHPSGGARAMGDVANYSRASYSPVSPVVSYADRVGGAGAGGEAGYVGGGERVYATRQDGTPLPPLTRTMPSAVKPETLDRPMRYSPPTNPTQAAASRQQARSLQLPPIAMGQANPSTSMPATPMDDGTIPSRARSHSEIDAEHKSLLWSGSASLRQAKRTGHASGPERSAPPPPGSSLGHSKAVRYTPYARSAPSDEDVGNQSRVARRGSNSSSSPIERDSLAKPVGLPEPMLDERSEYRRQIGLSYPREEYAPYQKGGPSSYPHPNDNEADRVASAAPRRSPESASAAYLRDEAESARWRQDHSRA